jgi:hypothetical protein
MYMLICIAGKKKRNSEDGAGGRVGAVMKVRNLYSYTRGSFMVSRTGFSGFSDSRNSN